MHHLTYGLCCYEITEYLVPADWAACMCLHQWMDASLERPVGAPGGFVEAPNVRGLQQHLIPISNPPPFADHRPLSKLPECVLQ